MRRSLRLEVIVIVVATVTVVLALTQWLDATLSNALVDEDLNERGLLAARIVDSFWDGGDWARLATVLGALIGNHREILAVDVFGFDGDVAHTLVSTRDPSGLAGASPDGPLAAVAREGRRADAMLPQVDGAARRRLDVPILRNGQPVGAVQTDLSLAPASALDRRLRQVDVAMLALSVFLVSLLLGFYFRRRVHRPVAALISGMRKAEAGVLGARVPAQRSEEFDDLARTFNRMLERIEELTVGLQARVRQATADLSSRNRELVDANERLRQAQLDAARSERFAALGQMAATLAHDLGTPLNAVLGYTQLLRRARLAPEHAAKLEILESQVRRMIETIRNLLDRTRQGPARPAPVSVPALVAEALEMVDGRLAARAVQARADVPAGVPAIAGDAVGLRQALVNLITNAIDAVDAHGTITVRARDVSAQQGARTIEIAVADDGPGIDSERLPHIFEPFYTTKSPGAGTGLGLAIVDRIVQAHNGHIAVDSRPGHGTTFRVLLPADGA
ncbi:MAG TPA: ATP-binding protein [Candidatus Binatia bacterium]|nr:ATP-binding protein [Candidatus Binatia bacterium]